MKIRDTLSDRLSRTRASRFYRQFVPRNGLCFDIGANIGNRTELFLALGASVVAVEPLASCATLLRERFGSRIELLECAVGAEVGEADMLVADYHTLSSLSPDWVAQVRASGRFAEFHWDQTQRVTMTTLDALVERYGVPDFCKIDVEGYELEVIQGLTGAVGAASYEFSVERLDSRLAAADHLASLGMDRFNFSFGESLRFALEQWTDLSGIRRFLESDLHSPPSFGDVYATPGRGVSAAALRSAPTR